MDMSEFDAHNVTKYKPRKLDLILTELDEKQPERAAKLRAALADESYLARAIKNVLDTWGYSDVTVDTVRNYRRGAI